MTCCNAAAAASRQTSADRAPHQTFVGISALLLAGSWVATVGWSMSSNSMAGMPMPGDWRMSMMRMPEQTWPWAAGSFVLMWTVMTAAMMLPSLLPALCRYRRAVRSNGERHPDRQTALAAAGYFVVWIGIGLVVFALGVALAGIEMRQPAVARLAPAGAAFIVIVAGGLQFTGWKRRHLACCRDVAVAGHSSRGSTGWQHGRRLGAHCVLCCANLMTILLVIGLMDLRAMVALTAAITVERLAPCNRLSKIIGVVVAGTGLSLIARAAGFA